MGAVDNESQHIKKTKQIEFLDRFAKNAVVQDNDGNIYAGGRDNMLCEISSKGRLTNNL